MTEGGRAPSVAVYTVGSIVRLDGRDCRIEAIDPSGQLTVRHEGSFSVEVVDPQRLDLGPCAYRGDLNQVSDAELARAMELFEALSPFMDCQLTRVDAERLAKSVNMRRSQLYALIQRLREAPHFTTLIRKKFGRKPGARCLPADVENAISKQISLAIKSRLPLTVKTIFEETEADCAQLGLRGPCRKTVRKRVGILGAELLLRRKYGVRRARERVSPLPGKIPVVAPLHDAEVDHSPLDIFLVSTDDRICIGRAYLTVVTDSFSRGLLGFNLGLDPPSALTVALALTHAVLPKDVWLSERGFAGQEWPLYGLMKNLRVDNAAEFKSPAFEAACKKWGINLSYRNKKEDGGYVERFIGTVQNWCSQEPGASGSDPKKLRGEGDRRDFAHMTLAEAEIWLVRQVLMRYHLERHSALGVSPLQAWRAGLLKASEPRVLVRNEEHFFISFLPSVQRVINHDGVRLFNETYFSSEARAFVRPNKKRRIHYDPRCMGRAYVQTENGYVEIRYTEPGKERLSKAEIESARRRRRDENPSQFSTQQRVALVEENRNSRAKSQEATRAARKNEAARISARLNPLSGSTPAETLDISKELLDELDTPPKLWREGPL